MAQPIVSLDLPSRYKSDDDSRSEIDTDQNAAVDRALEPLDDYVRELAVLANRTLSQDKAAAAAKCLFESLASWAEKGALTQPTTMTASLSLSSRIAGIAAAYNRATAVEKPEKAPQTAIDAWLSALADQQIAFFETEAPPMASRNNHRAWAGLAVAQIALATGRPDLIEWASETNRLLICSANADGSLPEEMKRRDKALHYQLHAVAPIVLTASVLQQASPDSFDVCDGAIDAIVDFTLSGLSDPASVTAIAGAKQTFAAKKEKLRSFQIAWLEPYLAKRKNKNAESLAEAYRPLSNSLLGGNLTELYRVAPR